MADTVSQTLINKFNAAETALHNAQETVVDALAKITDKEGDIATAVQTAQEAKTTANAAKTAATTAATQATTATTQAANAATSAANAETQARAAKTSADSSAASVAELKSVIEEYKEYEEPIVGSVMEALDLAGISIRDIDTQRFTRNQVIDAVIMNRGVVDGVVLSKSTTATRNISATDGKLFCDGRTYPIIHQENTAHVANNTTNKVGYVTIYAFLCNGVAEIESTPLNEPIPDNGIELAVVTIPAGNTENNDPYLTKVTVTDTARHEPAWPVMQQVAGQVYVALNRELPDSNYMVDVEVSSATSFHQLGHVAATQKKTNGFVLVTTGTADKIVCKLHVKHPSLA